MVSTLTQAIGGALAGELAALAERVRAGVVRITNGRGAGSGTIWHEDGLIVTNYHVVPGERARVTLTDGREFPGAVVSNLPERDLAVIRIEARGLPALPVGDSTALRVGEIVMAVGHPLGVPGAATLGIYSGTGPIEGQERGGRHFREAILADIELRPGNSGGPLVNARGETIGINAMVMGPRTALAVPSATVVRLIGGRARRILGVRVEPIATPRALAARLGIAQEAALILVDVAADSPADRAGLLPGDIVLAVDGHAIEEPGDLAWGLSEAPDGTPVTIRIVRGGAPREVTVEAEVRAVATAA
ncbi:MAG: HtrA protease/chaperone protein [uncultured Thermomicrobiales bacterium]|uniref:HtrA protease/chaperone protein n=1 Tax=uncultured Thermomicrobiales bacterium TaxID=1645740 RepID=A0A6J4VVW3_9BACT|nr:MAG: HtrA protease/chaperone protein [uncultured Thermomicrobiales bacterium]